MESERWRQIEDLYHQASALNESRRAEFLSQACKGDEDLRREVESLLVHEKNAARFIESPAMEVAARLVGSESLRAGVKLDCYLVLGPLGGGGMGEVYRARDLSLKREVAIKILPAFVSQDPDRLRRFEQEAQAAAALNHPNILAVHQFGSFEGAPYLVS